MQKQRVAVARMHGRRKAERGRQPVLDARPPLAAIVAAIHAAMVLLIEPVRPPDAMTSIVHALPGFGVALLLGQEIAARAPIAGSQDAPASAVWNTPAAEMPTQICRSSPDATPANAGSGHRRRAASPVATGVRCRPETCARYAAILAAEQSGRLHPGVDAIAWGSSSKRPGWASRRSGRRAPRWSGSSSGRGRSTSKPPGRTTHCRRHRRSRRWQDRPTLIDRPGFTVWPAQ